MQMRSSNILSKKDLNLAKILSCNRNAISTLRARSSFIEIRFLFKIREVSLAAPSFFSIVPLNRRRIGKLEVPADQNVRGASLILNVTRRNGVEGHLKNLAANCISAINKLSIEGEGHGF